MWSWIAAAVLFSFSLSLPDGDALRLAKICAFVAIALGGAACVLGGLIADRIGKARFSIIALSLSAAAALATAITFGGPTIVTFTLVVIWGIAIIPDSAQFSALVADHSPPESAGSIMTLQTAFGFLLTFFTVQAVPGLVQLIGWQWLIASLALGPMVGIWAMRQLLHYHKTLFQEAPINAKYKFNFTDRR